MSTILTIRDEQMHVLSADRLERFAMEAAAQACQCWPGLSGDPCDSELLAWILRKVQRASALGWKQSREMMRYLNVTIALGDDFESNPCYPRVLALMRSRVQKQEKLDRLCKLAEQYLYESGGAPVIFGRQKAMQ